MPAVAVPRRIIGDLSEEYLRRKYTDGPLAARLWYYRQALASAPHLAAHWAARAAFGSWIGLTAAGIIAMCAATAVVRVLQVASVTWWGVDPNSLGIVQLAWRDMREAYPLWAHAVATTQWLTGIAAGYVVARRYGEAPITAAGVAAVTTSVVVIAFVLAQGLPLVFGLWFNLALWTFCMLAGGMTAALTRHAAHEHLPVD